MSADQNVIILSPFESIKIAHDGKVIISKTKVDERTKI
jgi:hypothetical protein